MRGVTGTQDDGPNSAEDERQSWTIVVLRPFPEPLVRREEQNLEGVDQ